MSSVLISSSGRAPAASSCARTSGVRTSREAASTSEWAIFVRFPLMPRRLSHADDTAHNPAIGLLHRLCVDHEQNCYAAGAADRLPPRFARGRVGSRDRQRVGEYHRSRCQAQTAMIEPIEPVLFGIPLSSDHVRPLCSDVVVVMTRGAESPVLARPGGHDQPSTQASAAGKWHKTSGEGAAPTTAAGERAGPCPAGRARSS